MEQIEYVYHLFARTGDLLKEYLLDKPYEAKDFILSLLGWIAQILDSPDALFLSWPDSKRKMRIREPNFINTPKLKSLKAIGCFDKFDEWLNSDEPTMSRNHTSDLPELKKTNINSFILTKVVTNQDEFQVRLLLMVCNRTKPVFEEHVYVSYDRLFCDIVQLVFKLHVNELYKQYIRNYEDAKERYGLDKSRSSLFLKAETADRLLLLYNQYCAKPPSYLIYDCLDANITLFNTKLISKDRFKTVLDKCKKYWRSGIHEYEYQNGDLEMLRYALARGYFALGIEDNQNWMKGKIVLNRK